MDYAQMLGMQGGNQQAATIGTQALAGNAGATLLGGAGARIPQAAAFNPQSNVGDLLTQARQQVAAQAALQPAQPTPQSTVQMPQISYPGVQATTPAAQTQIAAAASPQSPALAYQMREMQNDPYYQLTKMQAGTPVTQAPPVPSWEENPYYWLSSGQQPVAQTQQPAYDPADWRTWSNG
jgi:hypothetical protein